MANFWTENFSWEEGKYSPKNILAPKEEEEVEAEERDERKLYDEAETEMDNVEEIISEIYDDDWQTMQAESSYKANKHPTRNSKYVLRDWFIPFASATTWTESGHKRIS